MAIDPRISMAINPLDIHGAVRNALTNVATVQNMQRQSEQDEVLRQEQQLLNQMLSGIGGQGVAATQPHMVVPEGSTTISPGRFWRHGSTKSASNGATSYPFS